VAYVAGLLGLRAVICLSQGVPGNKVRALSRLGAETVVHGRSYDEAMANACSLQAERGLTMIHPFDDPLVIAGQGTIGQELLEDLPAIDTVIAPLSGGRNDVWDRFHAEIGTAEHPGSRSVDGSRAGDGSKFTGR